MGIDTLPLRSVTASEPRHHRFSGHGVYDRRGKQIRPDQRAGIGFTRAMAAAARGVYILRDVLARL